MGRITRTGVEKKGFIVTNHAVNRFCERVANINRKKVYDRLRKTIKKGKLLGKVLHYENNRPLLAFQGTYYRDSRRIRDYVVLFAADSGVVVTVLSSSMQTRFCTPGGLVKASLDTYYLVRDAIAEAEAHKSEGAATEWFSKGEALIREREHLLGEAEVKDGEIREHLSRGMLLSAFASKMNVSAKGLRKKILAGKLKGLKYGNHWYVAPTGNGGWTD